MYMAGDLGLTGPGPGLDEDEVGGSAKTKIRALQGRRRLLS